MTKLHRHHRFAMLICLTCLSACASPGEKQQISENCAVAKEKQADRAIEYWCFGRRPDGY
jgi:hypothetical protein